MANKSIVKKIQELKRRRKAIVLVHNYQIDEVQGVADFLGDSLELSRKAAQTEAEVIVFCGVHFMAETASILSPDKLVLIPDQEAGCPMANMITSEGLRALKSKHPKAVVVAYVNTTAAVKAEVDICCTSANGVDVVSSIPEDREIIFVPDKYLSAYVSRKTSRKLIPWEGYCHVHVGIQPEDILRQHQLHPQAIVMVHPECTPEVIELSDEILSTSGMVKFAREAEAREFIVGTEIGLLTRLTKENPDKIFYPASESAICPNMKKITLEKVLWSLEDLQYRVKVPEEIRLRAKKAVDAMLNFH